MGEQVPGAIDQLQFRASDLGREQSRGSRRDDPVGRATDDRRRRLDLSQSRFQRRQVRDQRPLLDDERAPRRRPQEQSAPGAQEVEVEPEPAG